MLVQKLSLYLALFGLAFFLITVINSLTEQKPQVVEQQQNILPVEQLPVEKQQKPQVVEQPQKLLPTTRVREERIEGANSFNCFQCPRRCAEYSSCKFAKFCAFQCGLYYLDGDNDGVPCEWTACRGKR